MTKQKKKVTVEPWLNQAQQHEMVCRNWIRQEQRLQAWVRQRI